MMETHSVISCGGFTADKGEMQISFWTSSCNLAFQFDPCRFVLFTVI